MTKEIMPEPVKPKAKRIDRRKFLELSRKFGVVAPPAVGLLIAATDAKAHCNGRGGKHGAPSCDTNH